MAWWQAGPGAAIRSAAPSREAIAFLGFNIENIVARSADPSLGLMGAPARSLDPVERPSGSAGGCGSDANLVSDSDLFDLLSRPISDDVMTGSGSNF